MPRMRARVVVEGLVQGVMFRGSMQRQAQLLGVTGWVRNLPDGNVEALLEGERPDVERLIEWCRHGPSMAEVESVEVREEPYQGEFYRFSIVR